MKPYLFLVFSKPTDAESKKGETPSIVVPLTAVLANDDKHASLIAGREIPSDVDLNRVEIVVRPF